MDKPVYEKAVGILKWSHPWYADTDYFSLKHKLLIRNCETNDMDLMTVLNSMIGYHEENISRVSEAVRVAIKYESRVWGIPVIFDKDGYEMLKDLRNIVEDSDDNEFILMFKEVRQASGIYMYKYPVLIVIDIDHERPIYSLKYNKETDRFEVIQCERSDVFFQCFDIYDGLSVGDPFAINETEPPMSMYEAAEDICHQMTNHYLVRDCSVFNVNNDDPDKDKELELVNQFMSKQDIRTCRSCNNKFILSADEKKWYDEKHFTYPKSCAYCRHAKREEARRKAEHEARISAYHEYGFYGD